ncbi:MAG: hypothetical protein OJF50_001986 [Nitrospira sp.]|jgi:hypothetical protein|nr:hypothetical protein [Nitrospira sp.]
MQNDRGTAQCSSCDKVFRKLDLTNRDLCQGCAKAGKPPKR